MRWFSGFVASALLLSGAASAFAEEAAPAKIVFVAGKPSHAPWEHEHKAGCILLAQKLEEGMPGVKTQVVFDGWPEDESVFEGASAVVVYSDGGGGHPLNPHLEKVDAMMKQGIGLVCIHYAVETLKGPEGDKFLEWLGGYFETHWSVNPHWKAKYETLPDHPITRGVPPFEVQDEWYYHMRFAPKMEGVTPILSALPPKHTLRREDGPHSGNPHVRKAVENGEPQHTAWAYERGDSGRGFGFTGGHFHKNWKDDNFRRLVLNAIAWSAKLDVPEGGIQTTTPDDDAMKANVKGQP
jgi:type 1 glutamine amidotransferase